MSKPYLNPDNFSSYDAVALVGDVLEQMKIEYEKSNAPAGVLFYKKKQIINLEAAYKKLMQLPDVDFSEKIKTGIVELTEKDPQLKGVRITVLFEPYSREDQLGTFTIKLYEE